MDAQIIKIRNLLLVVIIPLALFIISCNTSSGPGKSITFKLVSAKPLKTGEVYLTGNNKTLGKWNPAAVKMDKQSDSVWTKTLPFNEGEKLEFKFTLGDWKSEAVNSDGWLFSNFTLNVKNDTTCVVKIANWRRFMYSRIVKPEYVGQGIWLINNWKYHPGDNPEWASPDFNDSSWQIVTSNFSDDSFSDLKWNNIGWFRTRMHVDSSLWNKTIGFKLYQLGASEIYYNGKLFKSFGQIGTSHANYSQSPKNSWEEFTFEPKADQVIAVRYANYEVKTERSIGYDPGFSITLLDLRSAFKLTENIRSHTIHQMVFTVIPLILFFLHLFLYLFLRRMKQNLYYAFCLLGFAGLTYFNYERFMVDDVGLMILLQRLNTMSASTTIFFSLLTLFEISYHYLPKRWRLYLVLYIAIFISSFFNISPRLSSLFIYVQFGFTLAEGLYAGYKQRNLAKKGTLIILTGFILMSLSIILQILIDYSLIKNYFGINQFYAYGMICFVISMSLYLSYNFAFVNKDLEMQLGKVKHLSEKAIEQERIAARLEIERRFVEAENERKTRELDAARELQLSLLPRHVPQPDHLEIACYMKTAAEVGGDYYDFHLSKDNIFTAVIGDATGHGLKAGNMVILTKGLFNTLADDPDLVSIINTFNRSIKKMDLHMLTMCMSLIRIRDNNIEYVSAGMPPMQIYRKSTGQVEEYLLKGMPLGAFNGFPYNKLSADAEAGDVILIMSDGLTEMFNEEKEIYGMERILYSFRSAAERSAGDILEHICTESKKWAGDAPLADDLTIVVIKIKG